LNCLIGQFIKVIFYNLLIGTHYMSILNLV